MSLRIRRGTEAERSGIVFDLGEIVWTTNGYKLYVGDGTTQGGINIAQNLAGDGLQFDTVSGTLQLAPLSITTDDVAEGTKKYFSAVLARTAVGAGFADGVASSNVEIVYNDVDDLYTANAAISLSELTDVNIVGTPANGATIKWDTATSKWIVGTDIDTGIVHIVSDTTPQLGATLDLNGYGISGTGNINTAGTFTMTYSGAGAPGPNMPALLIQGHRGTVESPTNTQAGDVLGRFGFLGLYNGTYASAGNMYAGWESNAVFTDTYPASQMAFVTNAGGSSTNVATFDSKGVLSLPTVSVADGTAAAPSIRFTSDASQDSGFFHPQDGVVCISTDAQERVRVDSGGMRVEGFLKVKNVAGVLPDPAEAGMIVFDAGVFKGYNGSSWVTLGA